MNFELIRLAIAVGVTSLAAYQDAKTSFIDDRMTIAMIAIGTLLNLASGNWDFILFSIGLTVAIFAIGYLLYISGQLGGGDVLLFCGIQSLLPIFPVSAMVPVFSALGILLPPMPAALSLNSVPFILSIYLASSFIGIAGSGIMYAAKLYSQTHFRGLHPDVLFGTVTFALTAVLLYWLSTEFELGIFKTAIAALFLLPAVFLITFKKDISDKVALRMLKIDEMEEEDIIDISKMPKHIVDKYQVGRVLTDDMKKVLLKIEKSEGIHKFPIQKDLPRFGPYILLGLLVSLYFADPLSAFLFY